jgi:hypothetical protein
MRRIHDYIALANNPDYSNSFYWGTDAQALQVKPGQRVRKGDVIGWAGNTGFTGVYGITPRRNNVHLHFAVGVFHDDLKRFVLIDPYGAYARLDYNGYRSDRTISSGYHPFSVTRYPRFFVPTGDGDFSGGVPLAHFASLFGYYANLGMRLNNDFRIKYVQGRPVAFGSFDSRPKSDPTANSDYYAQVYSTVDDYDKKFRHELEWKQLRPFKGFVTMEPTSPPRERLTTLWVKKEPGQDCKHSLYNEAELKAESDKLLPQGYRLDWKFPYVKEKTQYYLAIFVKGGKPPEKEPPPAAGEVLKPQPVPGRR